MKRRKRTKRSYRLPQAPHGHVYIVSPGDSGFALTWPEVGMGAEVVFVGADLAAGEDRTAFSFYDKGEISPIAVDLDREFARFRQFTMEETCRVFGARPSIVEQFKHLRNVIVEMEKNLAEFGLGVLGIFKIEDGKISFRKTGAEISGAIIDEIQEGEEP